MTARPGLVWPLALIAIGIAFLAANFGLIGPISVVALLALWPLILIIVGIDLAAGRRWPVAALGADAVVIALAVALVSAGPGAATGVLPFAIGGPSGPMASTIDVPRGTWNAMTLRVSASAGTYELRGGATSLVLAQSDQDDLLLSRADLGGGRADVRVDQRLKGGGVRFGPTTASRVTVRVASDVATSLTVEAGAGEFIIDTSGIKLTDARISVGAASVRFVLPHPTGDVPIALGAGASSVVIEVPPGVEARVTSAGGLSSTRFENPRFSGSETSGYASAPDRVTVRISAGVTSIVVR